MDVLRKNLVYFFILFISLYYTQGYCQESMLRDNISVVNAIQLVEKTYNVKIFYQSHWFDNDLIGNNFVPDKANTDLDFILKNTGYRYISYSENYFIILKKSSQIDEERIMSLPEFRAYDMSNKYLLTGDVYAEKEEEKLIGATIFIDELDTGTISDVYGKFRLNIPPGKYHIRINSVGFFEETREIEMLKDTAIRFSLASEVVRLNEVVIREDAEDANISDAYLGITKLDIQTIKSIPALMGEVDVVRSLLMLPGVSSVGEASTGFNVRGGSVDQNLVLLDETPIFNTSHLFGLFSVFNQDVVKNVTLLRGGIPVRYGGRRSAVREGRTEENLTDKFEMKGGIGLISSR